MTKAFVKEVFAKIVYYSLILKLIQLKQKGLELVRFFLKKWWHYILNSMDVLRFKVMKKFIQFL